MHARNDCSEFLPLEASSREEDVSVSMNREAEKASSSEDESLEIVTILMSSGLGSVLVKFNVAESFCEGGRVKCGTGWDIEDEEQKKGVERRVAHEEHPRMFNKLIE